MNVLVVNCGSSSLKYQLLDMTTETELAKGLFEKIGDQDAIFTHKRPNADKLERIEPILNHKEALRILLDILVDAEFGVISSMDEIDAVGHRVVHGGEKFADSVLITPAVMEALEECASLAPLHNHQTFKVLKLVKLLCQMYLKLLYLILHSIKLCQKKHICMRFLTLIMKIMVFVVTASMVHPINM